MNIKPIRIMIVDDQKVFADSVKMALDFSPEFEVLACAHHAQEILRALKQQEADVLLMDVMLPEITGLQLYEQIRQQKIAIKVLGMSGLTKMSAFSSLWAAHINGLVHKEEPLDTLKQAIIEVAQGGRYLSPKLSQQMSSEQEPEADYEALSFEEKALLLHLATGAVDKDIAHKRKIKLEQLHAQRNALMHKIDAHSLADLIKYALKVGLIFSNEDPAKLGGAQNKLSKREYEVLPLLAKGFSRPEIAELLSLSHYTINDYVKSIYQKLDVSSRAEATREAIKMGLS